jgi:hypothetical protein
MAMMSAGMEKRAGGRQAGGIVGRLHACPMEVWNLHTVRTYMGA